MPLVLAESGEARVAVFAVLGHEVAVLHDVRLPSGDCLVRGTASTEAAAQRLTVVR
ncbi:MAG: hypothetical protein AAGI91_08180 [Bacteroidota bacterium]